MKPGRKQFTLGWLMLGIAILAVGFAYPDFSGGLLLCAIIPIGLIGLVAIPYYLVIFPCLWMIDFISPRLVSRSVPRPSAERKP